VAKFFNDHALEMVSNSNGRLVTLAQVPLQDTDAACREASRAMETGHRGIQIGNHVGPLDLDEDQLVTFLQHCAVENVLASRSVSLTSSQIPVLVHPWDMFGQDRMGKYMMAWTVGMPAETHLSIAALILSTLPSLHTCLTSCPPSGGAFDRLPKSLKLCFAHGGGAFAFLLPRMENAYLHRSLSLSHYVSLVSFAETLLEERLNTLPLTTLIGLSSLLI
jgi:aminocarboxymuconate-semialdehyde decarboxylase